ncbi:MAG: TlpA family protein disulfide reductase [Verrucomicrobia bacterium]|nr:TlpA family protein disulfide reductase [Verrucomicrobiota bacterium]
MKPTAPALSFVLALLSASFAGCAPQPPAPAGKQAAAPGAAAPSAQALPRLGPAPAWQLKDVNGAPVSSDQFKGKVVVVDFWATWCPPCRAEIPGYIDLVKKYGAEGLVIVGISLDQAGPEVVKAFAGKTGINYPLVMGDDQVVAAFGGVEGIPTTFLIDRTGQIRDRKVGAEETADYEKKLLAVLREKA